jgi:hypothetical protein
MSRRPRVLQTRKRFLPRSSQRLLLDVAHASLIFRAALDVRQI